MIRCVLKFCDGADPPPYVRETNNQQWVPDQEATQCMNCKAGFTTIRRRVSTFRMCNVDFLRGISITAESAEDYFVEHVQLKGYHC